MGFTIRRDKFLLNRWQTFNINFGNSTYADATGTMLVYVVNDIPGLEITFPDIETVLPQGVIDLGPDYTKIADSVAIYYVTDSLSGYIGTPMRVYPFYIPTILAASSQDVRVKIKVSGAAAIKMSAWMMDPFWENIDYSSRGTDPMPNEVRACITAAAMKMFAKGMIGLIPGAGCYGLVDKICDPIGHLTPESMKPAQIWGSWIWDAASWAGNITKCATSLMPGLGQAVSLGVGIANMTINGVNGWAADKGCWEKFKQKSKSNKNSKSVYSMDPNEIVGPQGYTSDNYISSKGNINYHTYFENKDTASSSALEVFIQDTLNTTKFDLSTFSFNTITFGDTAVKIQDYAKEFTVLVDRYPKQDIIVQVHGVLDTLNGVVSWDFHSLDRITLELTEDADLGFLPPNVNPPEGEANVAFSCKLKKNIAHDAIVTNKANIVFDFNAPMNTNIFSNKIDTIVPVSSVNSLNSVQTDSSFTVSWSGSDQGSGIFNYNIFVSENDSDYVLWQASAANITSAVFTGHNGSIYKFYCLAMDSVGLTEGQKTSPEAITTITVIDAIKEINKPVHNVQLYPNPAADIITLNIINANNEDIEFDIYTAMGVLVKSGMFKENQRQINVRDLSDGVYMVTIKSKDLTENQRLIIQR
jgi:hypothetical protein